MSDFFAPTVQKSRVWVNEVAQRLGTDDEHRAYLVLKAAFHALRDRLPHSEMAQVAAQLPLLLRGVWYEGWNPSRTPVKDRRLEEFLDRVADGFPGFIDREEARRFAEAAFSVLAEHITPGELEDVVSVLPKEVRALFP